MVIASDKSCRRVADLLTEAEQRLIDTVRQTPFGSVTAGIEGSRIVRLEVKETIKL